MRTMATSARQCPAAGLLLRRRGILARDERAERWRCQGRSNRPIPPDAPSTATPAPEGDPHLIAKILAFVAVDAVAILLGIVLLGIYSTGPVPGAFPTRRITPTLASPADSPDWTGARTRKGEKCCLVVP
jgi:hypothetical protein